MEEIIFSTIAVIFSTFSLVYTVYRNRKSDQKTSLSQNINAVANIELQAISNPEIFQVHGISKEEIEETGYSEIQFAYLVNSFTAASLYYRRNSSGGLKSFNKGGYRYNIVSQPNFKKAWPVLKRMMENSEFRTKLDLLLKRNFNHD
tara:strand:+ start:1732 stop:2172 length:441 start_codon:yes stop_codon:yes gene_type:complete